MFTMLPTTTSKIFLTYAKSPKETGSSILVAALA